MIDFGHGAFSISKFAAQMAIGQKATKEVQEERESICRKCELFTVVKEDVFSCGKPVTEKLLRVRSEEGCGCWLNLKWLAISEKCPLEPSKWLR